MHDIERHYYEPFTPPGFPDPRPAIEAMLQMGYFSQEEATKKLTNDDYLRQNFDQIRDGWYQGRYIASLNGHFFIAETRELLEEVIKNEPDSRTAVVVSIHHTIFTSTSA